MANFGFETILMCTVHLLHYLKGERGHDKVYVSYTGENVDIFGRLLKYYVWKQLSALNKIQYEVTKLTIQLLVFLFRFSFKWLGHCKMSVYIH